MTKELIDPKGRGSKQTYQEANFVLDWFIAQLDGGLLADTVQRHREACVHAFMMAEERRGPLDLEACVDVGRWEEVAQRATYHFQHGNVADAINCLALATYMRSRQEQDSSE